MWEKQITKDLTLTSVIALLVDKGWVRGRGGGGETHDRRTKTTGKGQGGWVEEEGGRSSYRPYVTKFQDFCTIIFVSWT